MRHFVLAVIILAVLFAGGYTAIWHKEADDFKSSTGQSIAALNEKAKAMGLPQGFIRYDRIEVSGFPFSMVFSFTNPVIDLPIASFLRSLPSAATHTPDASAPASWIIEYSNSGPITLSGSIRGNHYTFSAPGNILAKSIVNNTVTHSILSTSETPLSCTLDVEQPIGGTFWAMRPVFSDAKTFFEVFRNLNCDTKGMTASDPVTHTVLSRADSAHIKLSHDPVSAANHSLALIMDQKNFMVSPGFDQMNYEFSQMAYAIMGIPLAQRPAPLRLSDYGEITLAADIAYLGPVDAAHFSDPNMQMQFDIHKIDFSSAIVNAAFDMHLASDPHGNSRTASIKLDSKANVSQKYDALVTEQTVAAITQAMQTTGKVGPELQIAQNLNALGMTPQQITAALLPSFHSFGDMAFTIDASVKGPNHGIDLFRHGSFTLGALDWVSAPYGITLKGNVDFSEPDGKPHGEITKTCIHCDALISDAGAYAMRIESLTAHMQPPHIPYVTPALIEGIRQFLHGIAENANAKDLVTDFKFTANTFTVSGKGLPEIMALYMSTIAPALPHPAVNGTGTPASELAPPAAR